MGIRSDGGYANAAADAEAAHLILNVKKLKIRFMTLYDVYHYESIYGCMRQFMVNDPYSE